MKNFFTGGERVRQARTKIESLERRRLAQDGALKPRHQNELDVARGVTRRHTLKLIGLGAASVGIPGLAVSLVSKPDDPSLQPQMTNPRAVPTENSEVDFEKMIAFQERQKQRTLRALVKFRDANPETRKLFDMLEKHAVYAIPVGPVVTQRIYRPSSPDASFEEMFNDPHEFEVVFMPEQFAHKLASPVVFGDNALRVAANITSDEWLAILIYHELSHAWDLHFGGEDPRDPEQWTDGEVRAHEAECKLIQHWQPEAYEKFLELAIPLWRNRNMRGIMELSDRLFPPPSHSEIAKGQMYGALIICAAFEDAKRSGRDLKQVYRNEILPTHQTAH